MMERNSRMIQNGMNRQESMTGQGAAGQGAAEGAAGQAGKKWQLLDATMIKGIAVILMFFDHVHQMYAWNGAPMWLTMLGRPVFPMFLFIAAESFHYTRDRKKYLKRLLFASWGMTILTFLVQQIVPNPNVVLMNNAFSTFFVTALYMQCWDWFSDGIRNKSPKQVVRAMLCGLIPVLCAAPMFLLANLTLKAEIPRHIVRFLAMLALLTPSILTVEGGVSLIVLGVLFYIFRERRVMQVLILLLLSALVYLVDGGIQWMMCAAAVPMMLYNGKRGRGLKNFFYVFYPAHIVILYLLETFTS